MLKTLKHKHTLTSILRTKVEPSVTTSGQEGSYEVRGKARARTWDVPKKGNNILLDVSFLDYLHPGYVVCTFLKF